VVGLGHIWVPHEAFASVTCRVWSGLGSHHQPYQVLSSPSLNEPTNKQWGHLYANIVTANASCRLSFTKLETKWRSSVVVFLKGEIIKHKNSGLVGFCTWPSMESFFELLDLEVVFINRFETFESFVVLGCPMFCIVSHWSFWHCCSLFCLYTYISHTSSCLSVVVRFEYMRFCTVFCFLFIIIGRA